MNLRTKFILIFVLIAVVPMALMEEYTLSRMRDALKERILAEHSMIVRNSADKIDLAIRSYTVWPLLIKAISSLQEIIGLLDQADAPETQGELPAWKQRLQQTFSIMAEASPALNQVRFLDKEGQEIMRVVRMDETPRTIPENRLELKADQDYFIEAMKLRRGEVYISPLVLKESIDPESPFKPVMRFATPVYSIKEDQRAGIIVVNISIQEHLDTIRQPSIGQIILIDQAGQFLMHPDSGKEFGEEMGTGHNYFREQPELAEAMKSRNFAVQYQKETGEYLIWKKIDYVPNDSSRFWILIWAIDERIIFLPADRVIRQTFIVGIVTIIIVLILALLMAGRLSRPLHELRLLADKIAPEQKDAGRKIRRQGDEIVRLRDAFEAMVDRLTKAEEELKRSNQELEKFGYSVSHDLKAPLANISSIADMLLLEDLSGHLTQEGREFVRAIRKNSKRMKDFIDGLLEYSRAAKAAPSLKKTELSAIVREVLGDLDALIQSSKAHIEAGPLPAVAADPLQMRRLFQNVIGNALKYTKPGQPPHIIIEAKETSGLAKISITDNGIGFSQKDAEKIFQPFTRLASYSQYPGSGIGLATCREIMQRHGGKISVQSTPGKGSTFTLELSLWERESETPVKV